MSDSSTVRPAADAATSGPYETRTINHGGQDYTFSFYKGFVSRLLFTPPGSTPIEVYNQGSDVFQCHDTGGPLPVSTVAIACEPMSLAVELEVDDGPVRPPKYRGCIRQFEVYLQRPGADYASPHKKVKVAKGGRYVQRIAVQEDGTEVASGRNGGVYAMQEGDVGTVTVENHAKTCPPIC
ncbi:MAG TPA: hypothetical protein VF625_07515 [Longimicrobium sp.]|jgi:hypothetical protein